MGMSPDSAIRDAGEYLLNRLLQSTSLPYSTFYDGSDATADQLERSLGLEDTWYSAEQLIDLAVSQLEYQGIVRTETLTTKLADGEDDYLIELTADGRKKLASGYMPRYWDAE